MALKCKLFKNVADAFATGGRKITVVGAGNVGMAIVACLLGQRVTNDICLVDEAMGKVTGETLDLQHGANFLNNAKITASTDFNCSKCSSLCIIAAGASRKKEDTDKKTRLSLMEQNSTLIQSIVPKLLEHSPNTILLMVTNPVDVMTYLAWKTSGLPQNRVIGSGTVIDSSRFCFYIGERLGIAPGSIDGLIIGEHGKSCVACWSSVSVGSTLLSKIHPEIGTEKDSEKWDEIRQKVVTAGKEVISLKGGSWWAVGLSTSHIARCLLDNTSTILPVTTNAKGIHDISEDIWLSLPCVLGLNGVTSIIKQQLSCEEKQNLTKSAEILLNAQKSSGC